MIQTTASALKTFLGRRKTIKLRTLASHPEFGYWQDRASVIPDSIKVDASLIVKALNTMSAHTIVTLTFEGPVDALHHCGKPDELREDQSHWDRKKDKWTTSVFFHKVVLRLTTLDCACTFVNQDRRQEVFTYPPT